MARSTKKKTKKTEAPSLDELKERLVGLEKELFTLRNELAINRKLEKPHLLKAKRREKARILTQLTQMAVAV
jgi:ribosomal protein L29